MVDSPSFLKLKSTGGPTKSSGKVTVIEEEPGTSVGPAVKVYSCMARGLTPVIDRVTLDTVSAFVEKFSITICSDAEVVGQSS